MTVVERKPKQLLLPITTGAASEMNQSQFLAITCNSIKAREKSRLHGAIGFGFASHWFKNWRESFEPTAECSNPNHVITFDIRKLLYLCPPLNVIRLQMHEYLHFFFFQFSYDASATQFKFLRLLSKEGVQHVSHECLNFKNDLSVSSFNGNKIDVEHHNCNVSSAFRFFVRLV